ncbi:MAG: hypothetical protein ACRCUE_01995, partial [Bosea sp. (in: a-proteobacteria)]
KSLEALFGRLDRWWCGYQGPPPRDLCDALAIAARRFPRDPLIQTARAEADLLWRDRAGQRRHDA